MSNQPQRVPLTKRGRWVLGSAVIFGLPLAIGLGAFGKTYDPYDDARAFLKEYVEQHNRLTGGTLESALLARKTYLRDEDARIRLLLPKAHGWKILRESGIPYQVTATASGTTRVGLWIAHIPALQRLFPQPWGAIRINLTAARGTSTDAEANRLITTPYGHPEGWTLADVSSGGRPLGFKMKPTKAKDIRVPTPSAPGRRPGQ